MKKAFMTKRVQPPDALERRVLRTWHTSLTDLAFTSRLLALSQQDETKTG